MGPPGARRAAVSGLVGAVSATALLALLHTAWPAVPFPPEVVAQRVARLLPGGVATFFVEHLGELALPLALVGTAVIFAASGAVTGLLVARAPMRAGPVTVRWFTASLLPLWAVFVAAFEPGPGDVDRLVFALVTLPAFPAGAFFASRTLAGLQTEREAREPDTARRRVLRSLVLGTVAVAVGAVDLGRLLYRRPNPGLQPLRLADVEGRSAPPAWASDEAIAATARVSSEITPNDRFYVADEEIIDPDIDPATWRLRVHGRVALRPHVRRADLNARRRAVPDPRMHQQPRRRPADLDGQVDRRPPARPGRAGRGAAGRGGGRVPAVRRGVLRQHRPGRGDGARGARGGGRERPRPPPGTRLPGPVLIPGVYGMKMVKWLGDVEVVDAPHVGYWERRGWSKGAIVKTTSRIDTPADRADVSAAVTVAGVAFAGSRGVSRVEVSGDAGRTWQLAELRRPLSPLTWVLWQARIALPGAATTVVVRAYDGSGRPQTAQEARPHPDGASGYDSRSVTVER